MSGWKEWADLQERLLAGERLACLELNRLITGVLVQLRAYDFREEWDDLRQEVALAVVENARRDRLRDPRAFVGYVRIITRNKLMDRLKRRLRLREREVLVWDEESARLWAEGGPGSHSDLADDPWIEVARLPEPERSLVLGIYREGCTYEEMAERSGLPLGTLKRRLRAALERLRERLTAPQGDGPAGDPRHRSDRRGGAD